MLLTKHGNTARRLGVWVIRPRNSLSFANLGVLYGYYLKDTTKAEENFLIALEHEPSSDFLYFQAFEFYKYVLEDTGKAKGIMEQGIENIPALTAGFQEQIDGLE